MGMDVFGKTPTSETGKYFRRNVWGWRPLADFILAEASTEAAACQYWYSNDGDGLDAPGAVALADKLDALVADGTVADWIKLREAQISALPDKLCFCCGGSGVRDDAVGVSGGWPQRIAGEKDADGRPNPRAGKVGSCNACGGSGKQAPDAANYRMEVSCVTEFAAFARDSGGFEIC